MGGLYNRGGVKCITYGSRSRKWWILINVHLKIILKAIAIELYLTYSLIEFGLFKL